MDSFGHSGFHRKTRQPIVFWAVKPGGGTLGRGHQQPQPTPDTPAYVNHIPTQPLDGASATMNSGPPRGHPAHPEMIALYGPPEPADASTSPGRPDAARQVQPCRKQACTPSTPTTSLKPPSWRDSRRARKEAYAYRNLQVFGPGGYKGYRERKYGEKSLVARLRGWLLGHKPC
jgi:hypothetical protein